jgi:hypothetical protein
MAEAMMVRIFTGSGLTAMVNRVDLDETGGFPLLAGVKGPQGDAHFEGHNRFGEAFAFHPQRILVFFEIPVDGGRAYAQELFPDFGGAVKGRPTGDEGHDLPRLRQRLAQANRIRTQEQT